MARELLMVSSSRKEPIVKSIMKLNQKALPWEFVSVEDIIQSEIFDELSDDTQSIRWHLRNGKIIKNENILLLNRVTHIPEKMFYLFTEHDKAYAHKEFSAYLGFALDCFKQLGQKGTPFGICANTYSLPEIWELAMEENMTVPEYYLGDPRFNCIHSNKIYSHPFYYHWWREKDERYIKPDVSFCFQKPKGTPIFICCAFGHSLVYSEKKDLDSDKIYILQKLAISLCKKFEYEIGEMLFFENKGKITLGYIIPFVLKVKHSSRFECWIQEIIVSQWLKRIS